MTIRLVTDPAATLAAAFHCLKPVGDGNCFLPVRHNGACLPLPTPRPHADITRQNPAYRRAS